MTVTVEFNGQILTKKTKRTGITHVIVSLYEGKREISGMYKSRAGAERGLEGYCNPIWSDHHIVQVLDSAEV